MTNYLITNSRISRYCPYSIML